MYSVGGSHYIHCRFVSATERHLIVNTGKLIWALDVDPKRTAVEFLISTSNAPLKFQEFETLIGESPIVIEFETETLLVKRIEIEIVT